jgi:hypothetical protein
MRQAGKQIVLQRLNGRCAEFRKSTPPILITMLYIGYQSLSILLHSTRTLATYMVFTPIA